jgi:cysteinyl-tRNA synthetase
MGLRIYNTLTRRKEELEDPRHHPEVRIYVCGVTVYDLSHVGHARSALVFDVIRRYLRFKGHQVEFVKNFTDVDDKIIKRAQEEGVPPRELAERYIEEYRNDMTALGVEPPDVEPKATEHIPQMIQLIERLLAQGFAYRVNGDVYFEVRRFARYGRLSGKNLDELRAGARVEVDERKRDPLDFALWKSSKPDEPAWESPWGPGRPGWHIECSAMSMHYLGETFDIHGGGEDLIFPHHENEIAQSEAATGTPPFVRCWIHNGFVQMDAEKMSKSLGNILTVKELVRRHDPDALRLYLLGTHYRNPVEFAEERVSEAARALERLRALIDEADRVAPPGPGSRYGKTEARGAIDAILAGVADPTLIRRLHDCCEGFEQAMDDDFNTPAALGALFDLSHELYRYRDSIVAGKGQVKAFLPAVDVLVTLGGTLGLFQQQVKRPDAPDELRRVVERLIREREEARKRRDWTRADKLREMLATLGVIVEDTPSGTRWKWKGA